MPAARPSPNSRTLGSTKVLVDPVSLGGEGVLRTHGQSKDAVPVILKAFELGVRYCDTSPAYAQSIDYYGEALRIAGPTARAQIFLASKTHERSRDASLRLLDDSLRRLGTDHLDLWQLHDLRSIDDLDAIFRKGGAIEALEQARAEGRVRFFGITGHHDPAILIEAMRRHQFDTVLVAINPADPRRLPFRSTVLPAARSRGMGVIGMKVLAAGQIPADQVATVEECVRYAATDADTVIIGCSSPAEVAHNLALNQSFVPITNAERDELERRFASHAPRYDSFKGP